MTTVTTTQESVAIKKRGMLETTQIAWIVLSTAFVVFCLFCVSVSFGAYYFVYQSTQPMVSVVQVARGSVGLVRADLTESFEQRDRLLSRNEQIITDSQSQAVVLFRDKEDQNQLVTSLTVKNNSEIQVMDGQQPRFGRGRTGYSVGVILNAGEIDIFVPSLLPRPISVTLYLPGATIVDISERGSYTLILDEMGTEVVVREGRAAILPPDRTESRPVVAGQVGIFESETGEISIRQKYVELVSNATFETTPVERLSASQPLLPEIETWNCSDRTTYSPAGIFEQVFFEGQYTLRLFRGIGTNTHGETACIQPFGPSGQVGRPVTGYETLEIRTTFYVQGHSLDACGIQGSECPMMLLMDYVDENGRSNQWFQGFYSQLTSRLDYPLTCVSCSQDHKRVNDGVWYTYESGNLFALLPEGARPASILNVRFYASGHDYDVYVGNLSLVASPPDPVQDSVETVGR